MLPVERSSMHVTSWPWANSFSVRCEPMNPAPPVIRVLMPVLVREPGQTQLSLDGHGSGLSPVPIYRSTQPIAKINLWFVREGLTDAGDISQRVLDIAFTRRLVCRYAFVFRQIAQHTECFVQSDAMSRSSVKNASGNFFCRCNTG